MSEFIIRLPLENAYNVRELGGYPTKHNKITKSHRFLRGDALNNLSSYDVNYLKDYGVKTIIDLRSKSECEMAPCALLNDNDIDYIHIPFMTSDIDDVTKIPNLKEFKLSNFYIDLLKEKQLIYKLMASIANAKDGCILYNCAAGKDRTGLLTMLILAINNVYPQDIISNYQVSYTNLRFGSIFSTSQIPENIDPSSMYSSPETIENCLEFIKTKYNNIDEYLLSCGVDELITQKIRERMLS